MSNNWTRLEKLEDKAGPPFEPMEWLRTVIAPGCTVGEPHVVLGVAQRVTCQQFRGGITETFDPPCLKSDLPPSLTTRQIQQVNEHSDACGPGQSVQVRRRQGGSGQIVVLEHGQPEREMMELLHD